MATKGRKLTLLAATAAVALLLVTAGVYWDDILVWYRLQRDFERLPTNEQGHPEYRHRQTGIVMVRVPGGGVLDGKLKGKTGTGPPSAFLRLDSALLISGESCRIRTCNPLLKSRSTAPSPWS